MNLIATKPAAVSEIVQLFIYPIKSCRGIQVQTSLIQRCGLELDRRWMFVDANTNKFLTIRENSEMTLIDTALEGSANGTNAADADDEFLVISMQKNSERVRIPARPTQAWLEANTTLATVNIWGHMTDGYVYSENLNNIFSRFMGRRVALVYKGPTPRILGGNGAPNLLGREESVNFPDVMPVQVANKASMQELNRRLKQKGSEEITIERFRPNIVIADSEAHPNKAPLAWSEDSWKTVRIVDEKLKGTWSLWSSNELQMDVLSRCARCQVPNVHPDTAVKDPHEPWDTLVGYRRVDEGIKWKPCFGMLCAPRSEGIVAVGMRFEVLETTPHHKYIKGF